MLSRTDIVNRLQCVKNEIVEIKIDIWLLPIDETRDKKMKYLMSFLNVAEARITDALIDIAKLKVKNGYG